MKNLQPLLMFASTVRNRGFASAARELGLTPSTVAKSVARLESDLGLKLFFRTTRRVTLTSDGQELFDRIQQIITSVEELESAAGGANKSPRGTLKVSMPVVLGRKFVLPTIAKMIATNADLSVEARFSDKAVDLLDDGVEVAIRVGELNDSRLVAKPLGVQRMCVCASPEYLSRFGPPLTPDDLSNHMCMLFRSPTSGRERPFYFAAGGKQFTLTPPYRLRMDDGEALAAAACLGAGIAQLPIYMFSEALRKNELIEILKDFQPSLMPINAVFPSNRLIPMRVRIFIDALAEALKTADDLTMHDGMRFG